MPGIDFTRIPQDTAYHLSACHWNIGRIIIKAMLSIKKAQVSKNRVKIR